MDHVRHATRKLPDDATAGLASANLPVRQGGLGIVGEHPIRGFHEGRVQRGADAVPLQRLGVLPDG